MSASNGDFDFGGVSALFVSHDYRTFSVPLCANAQPQLVDCLDAGCTADDLTGQIIWPVARATSAYLCAIGARELSGRACLELGAGCGLVGLVASRFASRLVLSDNEDEVMLLLARNLCHAAPGCDTSLFNLSWGSAADAAQLRAATGVARWPVLLGADVVYWPSGIVPLFESVAALLAGAGVFILGYNDRLPGNQAKLLSEVARHGLRRSSARSSA